MNPLLEDEISAAVSPICDKYAGIVVSVYLFGSTASGEATSKSDLDIAVLLSGHQYFPGLRFRLYADFSRVLKRNDIDIVILNTSTNLILQDDIIRHGVLLYDGNVDAREAYESKTLHMGIDFRRQRYMAMGA